MRAWAEMFNAFLAQARRCRRRSPYTDADYFAHVDGKPRYDGVARLARVARHRPARGRRPTTRPAPTPSCGLGNRKNDAFNAGARARRRRGLPRLGRACSTRLRDLRHRRSPSSRQLGATPPAVLDAAGPRRPVRDGRRRRVAAARGLPGKPAPDTFVARGRACSGVDRGRRAVVVEDAVSGVAGGRGRRLRARHRRRPRAPGAGSCCGAGADARRRRPRRAGPGRCAA